MLVIRSVLIVAAVFLSFLLDTRESYACTCEKPGPSPSEALESVEFVFSGKVVAQYKSWVQVGAVP